MATFKQQVPSRKGYFETLANLTEQQMKNKNLRTDSVGVESLATGEREAEKKATQVGENVAGVSFNTPEVTLPKTPDSVVDTQASKVKEIVDPILKEGTTLNTDQVLEKIKTVSDPARAKIAEQADATSKAITKALEDLQTKADAELRDHRKFIEKQMGGTAAQGLTGQKSAVEQGDLEIAQAMQDPSMRTSDVAQLAAVYNQFDPRLAALQGEIMRGEVSDLRGEALSALQGYTGAQAMKQATVGGLGDIETEARERLQKQEQDFQNQLTTTSQEALKGLSDWRLGQEDVLNKWEGDADTIAKRGAIARVERIEREGKAYANEQFADKIKAANYPIKVNTLDEFLSSEKELFKNPSYRGSQSKPILEWLANDPKVAPSLQAQAKGLLARIQMDTKLSESLNKQLDIDLGKLNVGMDNFNIRL